MTDKPKTHYEFEDIPPDDPDTKIALFEQSVDAVKGSAEAAEWLLKNAEVVLGEVYRAAEKAKDAELAVRVDDVWSGVQSVTTYIQRQGAVIAGSKEAIKAVKEQRDKVLEEIKAIREALNEYDTTHPELADYAETLQEMWEEDTTEYWDTYGYDFAFDDIETEIVSNLAEYGEMSRPAARDLFDLLKNTPGLFTDEQKDLLKKLGATLREVQDEG